MLSPRDEVQACVHNKKLLTRFRLLPNATGEVMDGQAWVNGLQRVYVLHPPGSNYVFAFHAPSYRLFRSVTGGSNKMTPTTLRTIIDPEKTWLRRALGDVLPGGQILLRCEANDATALAVRAAYDASLEAEAAVEKAERAEKKKLGAPVPVEQPVRTEQPTQENVCMGLVNVNVKRQVRVRAEIVIDRMSLIGLIRQQGVEVPRDANIQLSGEMMSDDYMGDDSKIIVSWESITEDSPPS